MRWRLWLILWTFPVFSTELEKRVGILEKEMEEVSYKTSQGSFSARFFPENFQKSWFGVFFSGNALCWNVKINESLSGWYWGYRVGTGVRLPVFNWKVVGNYTHYASCVLNYDILDFELRNKSFLSSLFGVETFCGIKKGWIDQKHSSFKGCGPQLGCHLSWCLLYSISFLTDVSASLMYGEYKLKNSDLKRDTNLFSANLNYFLGFAWNLYEKRYCWNISLGYAVEHYWNQDRKISLDRIPYLQTISDIDDFTLYGLVFRSIIEF